MDDRAKAILIFIGFCAFIILAKASQLQIFNNVYKEQARRTTLTKTTLYPTRGLIYDRNGELIVSNSRLYDINAVYNNIPKDINVSEFCSLLDLSQQQFQSNLNKDWSKPQFHKAIPYLFTGKIDPKQFSIFQEHLYKYPGFYPVERTIRNYNHQNAAHVIGFLGEVSRSDLDKDKDDFYVAGDYIGKSGLEYTYENQLRGNKGIQYSLKDNLGRIVSTFDNGQLDSAAIVGNGLITSLDIDLQAYGELLMKGKIGSIVAIEPSTGEILTMISSPSYNPELLNLGRDRGQFYDSLRQDTLTKPLFDRSVLAKYPPGSIFKTIFALIAMQKEVLTPHRTIYCDGSYEVDSKGKYSQGCHNHPTPYNVSNAIQYSCNSYFYQTFREFIDYHGYKTPQIGLDTLNYYLDQFGLGRKLGIDYHLEDPGYIPTSAYFNRLYGNQWRSTYILSLGIGQGEYQFTTLQMANLAAILANRGHYYTPHLVKKIIGNQTDIDPKFKTPHHVKIDKKYFEPVIEGMSKVATDGTARLAYTPLIDICGKTGTSQNIGEDHSVFFAFAPKEKPQIAIAVFVENAGWGGTIAAPIASLMIEKYVTDTVAHNRKWLEERMINTQLFSPAKNNNLTNTQFLNQ